VVDKQTGKAASAKNPRKWGRLFDFRSIFVDSPNDPVNDVPPVRITFPDGSNIFSDYNEDNDINSRLSEVFDREVTLMKASGFEEPSYEEYERFRYIAYSSKIQPSACRSLCVCT
jgi:uncharacterized protein